MLKDYYCYAINYYNDIIVHECEYIDDNEIHYSYKRLSKDINIYINIFQYHNIYHKYVMISYHGMKKGYKDYHDDYYL